MQKYDPLKEAFNNKKTKMKETGGWRGELSCHPSSPRIHFDALNLNQSSSNLLLFFCTHGLTIGLAVNCSRMRILMNYQLLGLDAPQSSNMFKQSLEKE